MGRVEFSKYLTGLSRFLSKGINDFPKIPGGD
jgi:hypothetical protein